MAHIDKKFDVLKPYVRPTTSGDWPALMVRSIARTPIWFPIGLCLAIVLWPTFAIAQSAEKFDALGALFKWAPFLVIRGFSFNILISFLCLALGTFVGILLGLGQVSLRKPIRSLAWFITQFFRNSPWLVILFVVMLAFPFEVTIFGQPYFIPGWIKAVVGLSLPIMANISEIVRGAIKSVPNTQWEASESLAFTRSQTMWKIILPQCFKRMIPPWMNWYAILTMATPLVSILGVEEVVNLARQAIVAEQNRPELLMPFYGFVLLLFFVYCYPIARLTLFLERKFAVKL